LSIAAFASGVIPFGKRAPPGGRAIAVAAKQKEIKKEAGTANPTKR
jgi:hypothetical protein